MIAESAVFCRSCGASEESGWGETEEGWSDSGDDEFDYDEFVRDEFPSHVAQKSEPKKLIILVLLISFTFGTIIGVLQILGLGS